MIEVLHSSAFLFLTGMVIVPSVLNAKFRKKHHLSRLVKTSFVIVLCMALCLICLFSFRATKSLNFYEFVNLQRSFDEATLRREFRRAALKYHPDHGGDTDEMTKLNNVRAVLEDDKLTRIYDRFGDSVDVIDLLENNFAEKVPAYYFSIKSYDIGAWYLILVFALLMFCGRNHYGKLKKLYLITISVAGGFEYCALGDIGGRWHALICPQTMTLFEFFVLYRCFIIIFSSSLKMVYDLFNPSMEDSLKERLVAYSQVISPAFGDSPDEVMKDPRYEKTRSELEKTASQYQEMLKEKMASAKKFDWLLKIMSGLFFLVFLVSNLGRLF